MRLTPLDIRKQEFKKGMRGLDPEEVYAFLVTVADEYEAVLNDNKSLRERLMELDTKMHEYRNMEKTLRDTLLTAERITNEATENARKKASLIIKEAELDAERAVRGIKESARKLREDMLALRRQRDTYVARMKSLIESHLHFIESAEKDLEEAEKEIETEARHTILPDERFWPTEAARGGERAPESTTARPAPEPNVPRSGETLTNRPSPPPSGAEATDPAPPPPESPEPPPLPQTARPSAFTPPSRDPAPESRGEPASPPPPPTAEPSGPLPREVVLERRATPRSSRDETSSPDLNEILDRMIENRQEMLSGRLGPDRSGGDSARVRQRGPAKEEGSAIDTSVHSTSGTGPIPTPVDPAETPDKRDADGQATDPDSETDAESRWSLERLKRDILGRRKDETD